MKFMNEPAVGTPLYFVPIRFWEDAPIETGSVALHEVCGEIRPSFSDKHVYAYHDGYGHNVYMSADRTFLTLEEAVAAKQNMAEQKKIDDDAEFEAFWQKTLKAMAERGGLEPQA